MEVDDVDQNLLQQFSCMGTTDHDVLIGQLLKLLGHTINETTASFFLDMNNWNLQAAVCSYFEFQSSNKLPSMAFVKDVTIGEGESVPPRTTFVKTWCLGNNGDEPWPEGCHLCYTQGARLSVQERVSTPALYPNETAEISVEMASPSEPGMYEAKWRMMTANGSYFGETIWVILCVAEGGTMAVTQQLSHFSALGSPGKHNQPKNPFAPQSDQRSLFSTDTSKADDDANMGC
nr:EOG090X0CQ9 [Triops cancriformis]